MSIENSLDRIANALEAILIYMTNSGPVFQPDAEPEEPTSAPVPAPEPAKAPKQARSPKAVKAETAVAPPAAAPAPDLTLAVLRARFARLAEQGHRSKLVELLDKRGHKLLPDVPAAEYAAVWADLDALEAQ